MQFIKIFSEFDHGSNVAILMQPYVNPRTIQMLLQ